jgi:NADPH2:quinone reductase
VISSLGGTGGYAQQVAVSAQAVIELPGELAVRDGLAVLADGRTALAAVRSISLHRGETALVLAAGGGVGSLLVQLAKHAGARVIAAAGSDRKLALARSLGADLAVDYTEDGWADGVGSVDVVFDGVGGAIGRAAFAQLRPGGRVSVIGMASGAFSDIPEVDREARDVSIVRGVPQGPEASRALVREALGMLATGQLRPTIGQTLDLRDASEAHRAIEARETLGKTLLIAG